MRVKKWNVKQAKNKYVDVYAIHMLFFFCFGIFFYIIRMSKFFVLPKKKSLKKCSKKKLHKNMYFSLLWPSSSYFLELYIYICFVIPMFCYVFWFSLFAIAYQTDVRDIVRSQISITKRLKVFPILHFCCRVRKSGKNQEIETKKIRIPASIWIWMICGQDEREKIIKYIIECKHKKDNEISPECVNKNIAVEDNWNYRKKSFVQSIWWRGFDRVGASQWKKGS